MRAISRSALIAMDAVCVISAPQRDQSSQGR